MTITKKQFKYLIVFNFSASLLAVLSSILVVYYLPKNIQDIINSPSVIPDKYIIISGFGFLILGVWSLQNVVALYKFKSYAPKHFLFLTLISYVIYLLSACMHPLIFNVVTNVEAFFYMFSNIFSTAILIFLFFSNIANEFSVSKSLDTVEVTTASEITV